MSKTITNYGEALIFGPIAMAVTLGMYIMLYLAFNGSAGPLS